MERIVYNEWLSELNKVMRLTIYSTEDGIQLSEL